MPSVLRFYDLRPIDELTGRRESFDPSGPYAHDCCRCGTRHARVFEVLRDDGSVVEVGEACMRLAFTGLSEEQITAARRAATARAKVEVAARRADVLGIATRALREHPALRQLALDYDCRGRPWLHTLPGVHELEVRVPLVYQHEFDRLRSTPSVVVLGRGQRVTPEQAAAALPQSYPELLRRLASIIPYSCGRMSRKTRVLPYSSKHPRSAGARAVGRRLFGSGRAPGEPRPSECVVRTKVVRRGGMRCANAGRSRPR